MNEGLPQLRMVHTLGPLPTKRIPTEGYKLRTAIPTDAAGMDDVLGRSFPDPWDADRVNRELLESEDVPTSYVIEHSGSIVGTASYQIKEAFPISSWLHWVGVDPDHRGFRLGYVLGYAILELSREKQQDTVLLSTDDFRLAAIKTYWT